MSKQDFSTKLKEISAISNEHVKLPNMPLGEAIQEAENLVAWCQDDKDALIKAGLNWALVDDLPLRAGACRHAQSIWTRESQTKEEAQKEWQQKSPAAYDLRDELLHHFTFAFRNETELVRQVQAIREGSSNADMLQDLSDLSVLGKENQDLLTAVGIDLKLLNRAAQAADELAVVLANANGESGDDAQAKDLRDRAYTYMKQAVDEIRQTGQYVFWRDEDRKKGYVSAYQKRLNQRRKGNAEAAIADVD
jgi:hypothetical protein